MSKDERSEFAKIIDTLYVIHCENKIIAEMMLKHSCYPKILRKKLKIWKRIGIGAFLKR